MIIEGKQHHHVCFDNDFEPELLCAAPPPSLFLSLFPSPGAKKIGRAPSEMHNNSGWGVDGATMAATEVRSISRLSVILTDLTKQELLDP